MLKSGFKIFFNFIFGLAYFPFWWYGRGFLAVLKFVADFLSARESALGLSVWIKNIFSPMYGQSDWQGKIISFFMRFVQIIARSIIMFFWLVFALGLVFFWLAVLPFVIYEIYQQINVGR